MTHLTKLKTAGIISGLFLSATFLSCAQADLPAPPITPVNVVIDTLHGHEITDNYRWLEDQQSEETRTWIDQQNSYTQKVFENLPMMDKLRNRLSELMRIDRTSTPRERNGRYFLYRRGADQDLWVLYMRDSLNGEDITLIDPHLLSEDHSISVGIEDISHDGELLAYYLRTGGQDETEIRFMDLESKQNLADVLPRATYSGLSISHDKESVYYTKFDENGPRVFYHRIGSDVTDDKLIFGEGLPGDQYIGSQITEDGRYLILHVAYGSAGQKNDIYYKKISSDSPIKPLVNDIDARFSAHVAGDDVFLKTDWEAPNGRILTGNLNRPDVRKFKEIIPHSDLVMQNLTLAGGKLCVSYLDSVKSRVSIFELDGRHIRDISFPGLGTVGGIRGRFSSDEAFFSFSSYNIPSTIYRYSISFGDRAVFDAPNIEVESNDFEVRQVWFESKDGTRIPMFLAHHKDIQLNSSNPTLITGYGGFNVSQKPRFASTYITWLENGGVLATVNLRGGGEFGKEWHWAGMFENKQNTFDDFYAAAEWLIDNKYTSPAHLGIRGGSNGGLLVGAALTQRPELYSAVICTYPLLDMLRYHKFLMGPFWVSEYGSADSADQFDYIHAYSPYHHVTEGVSYPAVMFITGDNDTRVDPCHARKMSAILQQANSSKNPILLRYDTKAGHSGGRPKAQIIQETAEELGFLFWRLGS